MIFLIIILLLILLIIILSAKNSNQRRVYITRILYFFAGIITLMILIRIIPPVFAMLSSVFITCIPFIKNISKLLSYFKRNHSHNFDISEEEARELLGVDNNATVSTIEKAYQKQLHENNIDKGGSDYITKRLMQARKLLLNLCKEKR